MILCVLDLQSDTGKECLMGINLWAMQNRGVVRAFEPAKNMQIMEGPMRIANTNKPVAHSGKPKHNASRNRRGAKRLARKSNTVQNVVAAAQTDQSRLMPDTSESDDQLFAVWNCADRFDETVDVVTRAIDDGQRRFIISENEFIIERLLEARPAAMREITFVCAGAKVAFSARMQSHREHGALRVLRLDPSPAVFAKHIASILCSIGKQTATLHSQGSDGGEIKVFVLHSESLWESQIAQALRDQCALRNDDGKNVSDLFAGQTIHLLGMCEEAASRVVAESEANAHVQYVWVICGSASECAPILAREQPGNVFTILSGHAYSSLVQTGPRVFRTGVAPEAPTKMIEFNQAHRTYFGERPTWATALGYDACAVAIEAGQLNSTRSVSGVTGVISHGHGHSPFVQDRKAGSLVSTTPSRVYRDLDHETEIVVSTYDGPNVSTAFSSCYGVHFMSKRGSVAGKNYIPRGGAGRLVLAQTIRPDVKISVRNMMGANTNIVVPTIQDLDLRVQDSQSVHVANDMFMRQQLHKCAAVLHSWKEELAYEKCRLEPDPNEPTQMSLRSDIISSPDRMFPGTFFATSNEIDTGDVTHIKIIIPDLGIPDSCIHQAAFHHIDMLATDTPSLSGTNIVVIVSPERLLLDEQLHNPEAPEDTLYALIQHLRFVYHHPGRQIDLHLADRAVDLFKHYTRKYAFAQYGQIYHDTTTGIRTEGLMSHAESLSFVLDQINITGHYARAWLGSELQYAPSCVSERLLQPIDDADQYLLSPSSRSSYMNMLRAALACGTTRLLSKLDLRGLTHAIYATAHAHAAPLSLSDEPRKSHDLLLQRIDKLRSTEPLYGDVQNVHNRFVHELKLENLLPTDTTPLRRPGHDRRSRAADPKHWDCLEAARTSTYVQTCDDAYCVIEPSLGKSHHAHSVRVSDCFAQNQRSVHNTHLMVKNEFDNAELRWGLWKKVVKVLEKGAETVVEILPEPVKEFVVVIVDGIETLVEIATPIVDAIATIAEKKFTETVDFLKEAIPAALGALADGLNAVIDWTEGALQSIAQGIIDAVNAVADFFVGLAQSVASVWNLLTDWSTPISVIALITWLVSSTFGDSRSGDVNAYNPEFEAGTELSWPGPIAFIKELAQMFFSFDFWFGIIKAIGESLMGKSLTIIAKNIIAVSPLKGVVVVPVLTFLNMIMNGQSFLISAVSTILSLYAGGFTKDALALVFTCFQMVMQKMNRVCTGHGQKCSPFVKFVAQMTAGRLGFDDALNGAFIPFRNALRSMEHGALKDVFAVIPFTTDSSSGKEAAMKRDLQFEAHSFQTKRRENGGRTVEFDFRLGVDIQTVVAGTQAYLQTKLAEWIIKTIFGVLCKLAIKSPVFKASPTLRNILCGGVLKRQENKARLKLIKGRKEMRVETVNPLSRRKRTVTTRTSQVTILGGLPD